MILGAPSHEVSRGARCSSPLCPPSAERVLSTSRARNRAARRRRRHGVRRTPRHPAHPNRAPHGRSRVHCHAPSCSDLLKLAAPPAPVKPRRSFERALAIGGPSRLRPSSRGARAPARGLRAPGQGNGSDRGAVGDGAAGSDHWAVRSNRSSRRRRERCGPDVRDGIGACAASLERRRPPRSFSIGATAWCSGRRSALGSLVGVRFAIRRVDRDRRASVEEDTLRRQADRARPIGIHRGVSTDAASQADEPAVIGLGVRCSSCYGSSGRSCAQAAQGLTARHGRGGGC